MSDDVTVHHGKCEDVLPGLPEASFDACVTDPPYEFSFMGKSWDGTGVAFKPETWAQVLRLLKPGGHLLAFGGSRTFHRLACAIEDAGFEIRDTISWLYGSGFPKSLDVSKAIDRRAEENVETKRRIALVAEVIRTYREAKGMERTDVSQAVVGTTSGACWNWEHHQLPSVEMWPAIKRVLDIPDKFDGLIEGDRGQFIAAEREVIGQHLSPAGNKPGGSSLHMSERGMPTSATLTAPATDDARRWQGWGTALKPAWEPVIVARKPLAGTVAGNVLAHGTGALNIDGCRIPHANGADLATSKAKNPGRTDLVTSDTYGADRPQQSVNDAGRWPANVVLDEDAAAQLDQQSGERPRGYASPTSPGLSGEVYGRGSGGGFPGGYEDTGGASRFYYTAKAAPDERPRANGISHPTVKPLDLIRWLVRLVIPPGGLVLDPFAGSGTTGEACLIEGFRCVLIEREADYLPLIQARLSKPIQPVLGMEEA